MTTLNCSCARGIRLLEKPGARRPLASANVYPITILSAPACFPHQAARGNAAAAGIKPGDTIIYASSFFGDELWPTDSKGLTQSALAACPSPVALVYVRPLLTRARA